MKARPGQGSALDPLGPRAPDPIRQGEIGLVPQLDVRREFVFKNPWITDQFKGLLVLGESHYGSEDAENDPNFTYGVVESVVEGRLRHALFTKTEIVVTGQASGGLGINSFWQNVAFANFCPGVVPAARRRPTLEMWEAGYALFPRLLDEVKPNRILVLGNATWNNIGALTDTVHIPTAGTVREAGRLSRESGPAGAGVPITSIRHPSSWGFSTQRWRAFYDEFLIKFP